MGFRKFIKDHDMFGHTVVLNFNEKGDTHNTFVGGLFTILIRLTITIYVFLKFKILINSEGDSDVTVENLLFNFIEEDQEVPYFQTKLIMIPNIQKVRFGHRPLEYDEEAKRYIELRYN